MSLAPTGIDSLAPCPCGSGLAYGACCKPVHEGAVAASPEALMRSRFCAYALCLDDYILQSWHPDTRPTDLGDSAPTRWTQLEILSTSESGESGKVHFRATFRESTPSTTHSQWGVLEEASRFLRHEGHWRYHSGEVAHHVLKPERNGPCPCGSGRKFKKCCGAA